MKRLLRSVVMVLSVWLALDASANDATYYVSAEFGDDNNDGLSWATAFKTLEGVFGSDMTGVWLGKGFNDTVMISNGTYYISKPINNTGCNLIGVTGDPKDVIIDGQNQSALLKYGYQYRAKAAYATGITFQHGIGQLLNAAGSFYLAPVALTTGAGDNMLTNCVIRDCTAGKPDSVDSKYCLGGGICIYRGTVVDCRVENCVASNSQSTDDRYFGGGIAIFSTATDGIPTIRDCVVSNCAIRAKNGIGEARGGGIGMYIEGIGCMVSNVVVQDCGIYDKSGNRAGEGGGIDARGGSTIVDCRVENCTAFNYGGIHFYCWNLAGSTNLIRKCHISGCVSQGKLDADYNPYAGYGALGFGGANNTCENCLIESNSVMIGMNAGIYIPGANTIIRDTVVRDNTAEKGSGAGFLISGANNSMISNCVIVGNSSNPKASSGGAIKIGATTNFQIVDTIIAGNSARSGAIIMGEDYSSSGIHGDGVTFRNCYIGGNQILNNAGIHFTGRNADLTNRYDHCTFADNVGGTLFRWRGYVTSTFQLNQWINACVFVGNSDDFDPLSGVGVNIRNTYGYDISRTTHPPTKVFVDAANGDYRLCRSSILVNCAMTAWPEFGDMAWTRNAAQYDMGDGTYELERVGRFGVHVVRNESGRRTRGGATDIGCFEYPTKSGFSVLFDRQ